MTRTHVGLVLLASLTLAEPARSQDGPTIKVVEARYGALSEGTFKYCDATAAVTKFCDGTDSCEATASNGLCGDPVQSQSRLAAGRILFVSYRCGSTGGSVQISEGTSRQISCKR